jgi:hypothetical protein
MSCPRKYTSKPKLVTVEPIDERRRAISDKLKAPKPGEARRRNSA